MVAAQAFVGFEEGGRDKVDEATLPQTPRDELRDNLPLEALCFPQRRRSVNAAVLSACITERYHGSSHAEMPLGPR